MRFAARFEGRVPRGPVAEIVRPPDDGGHSYRAKVTDGAEFSVRRHENLLRLKSRGLGAKRSLALREFALGLEALERFVHQEPLRRVHECVFGVLALESEPVDPRL